MAFSAVDSDIDDLLTPIGGSPHGSLHGQFLESDSPSDYVKRPVHRGKPTAQTMKKSSRAGLHQRKRKPVGLKSASLEEEDDVELTSEDVKGIYAELQAISDKLREENHILHERESKLKERERMLSISQESLQTITDHQIKVKMAAIEEKLRAELGQMDQALRERTKDNKRLKENFETIKQANDVLKKEVETLKAQNAKLSKSSGSLQARLSNLQNVEVKFLPQRKAEYEQKLKDSEMMKLQTEADQGLKEAGKHSKDAEEKTVAKSSKQTKAVVQTYSNALSTLLDWVCEAHLRQALTDLPTKPAESYTTPAFIHERVIKILPSLVDILRDNASNIRCCLPALQFIYWSLLHIDQIQTQQNLNMSTTLRRLGEEVYYPKSSNISEAEKILGSPSVSEKLKADGLFLRSSNSHVRFLSSLIVLKTLSRGCSLSRNSLFEVFKLLDSLTIPHSPSSGFYFQQQFADVLAQAFDVLKTELKSDQAKELFLYYQATNVVAFYLKPINKNFISVAVDVMLQMSADSPFQQGFLDSCSNEAWFRAAALIIRTPLPDIKILERLSIILQKLSKMKCNKRFFEVYTIVAVIQEMLVAGGNENAFLALNLKSILFNLNVASKP